jgi:hypothetical protein
MQNAHMARVAASSYALHEKTIAFYIYMYLHMHIELKLETIKIFHSVEGKKKQ